MFDIVWNYDAELLGEDNLYYLWLFVRRFTRQAGMFNCKFLYHENESKVYHLPYTENHRNCILNMLKLEPIQNYSTWQ